MIAAAITQAYSSAMLRNTQLTLVFVVLYLMVMCAPQASCAASSDLPQRTFSISKQYLNIPIKNGAPKVQVEVWVDGHMQVRNEMELAPESPDWWAGMDVSSWRGQKLTLKLVPPATNAALFGAIEESDSMKGQQLYREPLRQQFHFSARRGWNNDPNGLVYYRGQYHLFLQHNPYGWNWGNMHWGHAVSSDLVHWRELGDVLRPDSLGAMFSGSAVVDWKNTSGFGTPEQPPQVLIYTAAGPTMSQCLAYSADGSIYQKFGGNPIIPQFAEGNRDPKVMWHGPSSKWIMTLYGETNKTHAIFFLSSSDLKSWKIMSQVDGFFECPDFFELPVDGKADQKKWVLTAASSEYMVGTFDGTKFTPETPKLPGHRGKNFYAAQTYSDIPEEDRRRIQIGWFQTPTPGMPFNQCMTIPMELKLVSTTEGPRLTWTPVKELESLRASAKVSKPVNLVPNSPNPFSAVKAELVELRADFQPGESSKVEFNVRGARITYDAGKQELVFKDHRAPAKLKNGRQSLIIYCDRASLEAFASDGLTYVPMAFIPAAEDRSIGVSVESGSAKFETLEVHELNSAWNL